MHFLSVHFFIEVFKFCDGEGVLAKRFIYISVLSRTAPRIFKMVTSWNVFSQFPNPKTLKVFGGARDHVSETIWTEILMRYFSFPINRTVTGISGRRLVENARTKKFALLDQCFPLPTVS